MRKQGWYWPWLILLGTFGVIGMSVYTVVFAVKNPVQLSNDHINDYKYVDKNINDMITDKIDFEKSYTLSYLPSVMNLDATQVRYRLTDKAGKAVTDARFEVLLTRPNELNHDIALELEEQKNGIYTFKKVALPLPGRWDLFANVKVGDKHNYLRLRLDTRYPDDVLPFGTSLPMN